MSDVSDVPTNIKSMYKHLIADDPLRIIALIRADLDKIVKKIITLDSDSVLILGRKSNSLFKNFINQILASKPVLMAESFRGDVFASYSSTGYQFLIVDAIHTGDEVSKFYNMSKEKHKFSKIFKVFCYIGYVDGLKRISDLGLEIDCMYVCNYEKEYTENMKRLQIFYQSQIEPMETDIIYDRYTINIKNKKRLMKLISDSLSQVFSNKIRLKNNKIHTPDYIKQYSYSSKNITPDSTELNKIEIFKNIQGINKMYISVIFKIKFEPDKILMTCKNETLFEFDTHQSLKTTNKCKHKYVNNKLCPHKRVGFDKRRGNLKDILCATCVGNEINTSILDEFQNSLSNNLNNYNIHHEVKRIGNWLKHYN